MGDLRNKMAKLERDRRHAEWMAKHYPPPPPEPLLHCPCGHTIHERNIWAVPDGWRRVRYCCNDCLPADMAAELGVKQASAPPLGAGCTEFTAMASWASETDLPKPEDPE